MPDKSEPSFDTIALLLLCSRLGLNGDEVKPLTTREWSDFEKKLKSAGQSPKQLLACSIIDLLQTISLPEDTAARLNRLLSRRAILDRELERLGRLGIYVLTQADPEYPTRYRERLKDSAPLLLFYSGESALLGQPGIAVVGSRHLESIGESCARYVGSACGLSGMVLYSGGAKGVDTISMESALNARGTAVGILAENFEGVVRKWQAALQRGDLCLASPYHPQAGFSVGAAMGRNRLIYTLADFSVVVASEVQKGGTWAGAVENLRQHWVPLFVLKHENMPAGNTALLDKGGLELPYPFPVPPNKLFPWLSEKAQNNNPGNQLKLF
jgi:DNA processing protein